VWNFDAVQPQRGEGKMKSIMSALITILFTLGLTSAALAQEGSTDKSLPIPLTMKDLSGKSNVALSVPMLPADSYFGIAPMVSFQYAINNLSLGLAVPMAAYFPKESIGGDDGFALGNLTVNALYRMCTQGEWSLCFGGGVDIGAAVKEVHGAEGSANVVGLWGHEDFTYHWPESLVITPVLVAGITNGLFLAQAEFGTSFLVPTMNTTGRDTEVVLNFAVGGGVKLFDILIPLVEFRLMDLVTVNNTDPFLWLSFGARVQLGGFTPMFRISIPLNEMSKLDAPVHLEAALAYQF
jgi:hypothetical protein